MVRSDQPPTRKGRGGSKIGKPGLSLDPFSPHSEIFFLEHEEFDLFGDPVRRSDGKRGRPAHVATQENRNKVIVLLAVGWSNERIAAALHVSQPTLRRHYFSELKARDVQRDRLESHQLMQAMDAANKGNVGAMRLFNTLLEKQDLILTTGRLKEAQKRSQKPKEETPGKKLQTKIDAHETIKDGGSGKGPWGDLLTPGSGLN